MNTTPHVLRWVAADAFVTGEVRSLPSILRFAKDDFMEQMLRTLAQRPQALPALVAQGGDGWQAQAASPTGLPDPQLTRQSRVARTLTRRTALRGFRAADQPVQTLPATAAPIKLFQPVHQRYYLAAAHLVCEQPGLPPRVAGAGDRSAFVLRQIVDGVEHGFVKGEDGQGRWVKAAAPESDLVTTGPEEQPDIEELLPLFPLAYAPPNGPPRTLLAGLVPVARHDEYAFAPRLTETDSVPLPSAAQRWKALAVGQVIEPWQALINLAASAGRSGSADAVINQDVPWDRKTPNADGSLRPSLRAVNLQLIEGSWRVLQGFREWLTGALPDVEESLGGPPPAGPKAAALHAMLGALTWIPDQLNSVRPVLVDPLDPSQLDRLLNADKTNFGAPSLRQALLDIVDWSDELDAQEDRFKPPAAAPWPDFGFPLALASDVPAFPLPYSVAQPQWPGVGFTPYSGNELTVQQLQLNAMALQYDPRLVALLLALHDAVDEAADRIKSQAAQAPAAAELAQRLAVTDPNQRPVIHYALRFVHLRCDCGPVAVPVISERSAPFELASFFDPEAPLRPIRIALPFDTSPGGLRKYGKNSAFIVSDLLCGQMKRVRKLGFVDLVLSVLPWPFHKSLDVSEGGACNAGGNNFGMICSLSIPIITIVAFVLLIVIATLLDLIFRWMPFLIACFPVPGLKGKK